MYKTGTAFCSFEQVLHPSSLQLQLFQGKVYMCTSEKLFFGFLADADVGAQDILGIIHTIMDDLDILEVGVFYSEHRHLVRFSSAFDPGHVCFRYLWVRQSATAKYYLNIIHSPVRSALTPRTLSTIATARSNATKPGYEYLAMSVPFQFWPSRPSTAVEKRPLDLILRKYHCQMRDHADGILLTVEWTMVHWDLPGHASRQS
jgi:hypothetical protein